MKIAIIFSSKYGTTERLASAMAAGLAGDHDVRLVRADSPRRPHPAQTDLLLVGAPTHLHGWLLGVRGVLGWLRRNRFGGIPAAAFDTRMPGDIAKTGSAAKRIAEGLRRAGCVLISGPESFVVKGKAGPLAEGEEARAVEWVRQLAREVAARAVPLSA